VPAQAKPIKLTTKSKPRLDSSPSISVVQNAMRQNSSSKSPFRKLRRVENYEEVMQRL
jgi:hypothetical protein